MVARMSSSSAGGESATYFTEPPDFHISPRALHSQECFLPLRGGFNLRCTRERYIPKNVFFLREEVLIYDAPSLPRKDSRFDQELPSIRGRKCGVKGLVQWRGLMVWSRSWFRWSSPRPNIAKMYCTECIIGIIQNVQDAMDIRAAVRILR